MSLPALYQLTREYQEAYETLSDLNLPEEVFADTLEGLQGEIEKKAENVACVIRNFESMAEQIKQAEKQLKQRRDAYEHRAEHIRAYLLHNMQACGISKIESPWFKIAVRDNPESVEITGSVPPEYMRQPEPPPPAPDKAMIKADLKDGKQFDFARLTRTQRVEIK